MFARGYRFEKSRKDYRFSRKSRRIYPIMNRPINVVLCSLALALCGHRLCAQGTAFIYQGRLSDGGGLANGTYDFRFSVYDDLETGTLVSGPSTNGSTVVTGGLFSVILDFGEAAFPGTNRWLEIATRTNGQGSFTVLFPRQPITTTPYAILAKNISGILSNSSLSGTYSRPLVLNNASNFFAGNAGGLSGIGSNQIDAATDQAYRATDTNRVLTIVSNTPLVSNLDAINQMSGLSRGDQRRVPVLLVNTFAAFGANTDEVLAKRSLDSMATNGLVAAGFDTFVIDDGWTRSATNPVRRAADGGILVNTNHFPSATNGLKYLADYAHARGIKLGLYFQPSAITSAGYEGLGANLEHIEQDWNTVASWGIDYIKFDSLYESRDKAVRANRALLNSGRSMVLTSAVDDGPIPNWLPQYVNAWRPVGWTGDDHGFLLGFLTHFDDIVTNLPFTGPGHWAEIEVRNDLFSEESLRVRLTMASIVNAGITLANVLDGAVESDLYLLTNREVFAVAQDAAVIPPFLVEALSDPNFQIWCKPLGAAGPDQAKAVAFFNRAQSGVLSTSSALWWTNIGIAPGPALVRDLWRHTTWIATNGFISPMLKPMSAEIYRIEPLKSDTQLLKVGKDFFSDLPWQVNSNVWTATTQKDRASNGDQLTLGGVQFAKGFGVLADTKMDFYLGGQASSMHCLVGVHDAYRSSNPKVRFLVYVDNTVRYDSGLLPNTGLGLPVNVDLTRGNWLSLIVTNQELGNQPLVPQDSVDIADAYLTAASPVLSSPVRVPMPLAALATENATPFFGQDTPAPVYFKGTALCLPLTNAELGVRFHAGLSVYPEKSVAVHKFTVQATNTLAFTNLIFGDMGAGPDSVRHYNYTDNVPCLVTNGINYLYFTNTWPNPNDLSRWLYLQWFVTTTNTSANIYVLHWDVTYE